MNHRTLIDAIAARTPGELVGDVISEMHAERNRQPRQMTAAQQHKSRQYIACGKCGKAITMDDVQLNECAHCGVPVYKKG